MSFFDRFFAKEASDYSVAIAEKAVGDIFKQWLSGDVGKYIVGRAEQYELEVLRRLSATDPKDTVKLIELQCESKIPGKLLQWISEVIVQGDNADFMLNEVEDDLER